jgi:hypothetical protein
VIVGAVAGVGIIALVMMLRVVAGATGSEQNVLQVEAIKYGLGSFAVAEASGGGPRRRVTPSCTCRWAARLFQLVFRKNYLRPSGGVAETVF